MSKKRFDQALAKFIRRGDEPITPQAFFQILAEIERKRAQTTIELEARIIKGQLQFSPSPELSVQGNEMFLGDQRVLSVSRCDGTALPQYACLRYQNSFTGGKNEFNDS